MFTQSVEYALRAVVLLAEVSGDSPNEELGEELGEGSASAAAFHDTGHARTAQQIAEAARVPQHYLAKVMQALAKAGIVTSQRGVKGGFKLAHAPGQLTVLDVVNAVDPIPRIATCPLGLKQHGKNLCPLHKEMDNAMANIERTLASHTFADLLNDPNPSKPLCGVGPDDRDGRATLTVAGVKP